MRSNWSLACAGGGLGTNNGTQGSSGVVTMLRQSSLLFDHEARRVTRLESPGSHSLRISPRHRSLQGREDEGGVYGAPRPGLSGSPGHGACGLQVFTGG